LKTTSTTGIQVKTSFFPLAFFLFFCDPVIVIDHNPLKAYWGTRFFSVTPGKHTVKVYFRYFWMAECGANSIKVRVERNQIVKVNYFMPPLMFVQGSLKIK
jgi:hypothetical protein